MLVQPTAEVLAFAKDVIDVAQNILHAQQCSKPCQRTPWLWGVAPHAPTPQAYVTAPENTAHAGLVRGQPKHRRRKHSCANLRIRVHGELRPDGFHRHVALASPLGLQNQGPEAVVSGLPRVMEYLSRHSTPTSVSVPVRHPAAHSPVLASMQCTCNVHPPAGRAAGPRAGWLYGRLQTVWRTHSSGAGRVWPWPLKLQASARRSPTARSTRTPEIVRVAKKWHAWHRG